MANVALIGLLYILPLREAIMAIARYVQTGHSVFWAQPGRITDCVFSTTVFACNVA